MDVFTNGLSLFTDHGTGGRKGQASTHCRHVQPEPRSLEANVLFMGANYLVSPLTKAALDMFPGCCVGRLLDDESNEIVAIDNHIKFDFVRFFLTIIS